MRQYRVLIAEDEDLILQNLKTEPRWSELYCEEIITASNGQDGLRLIQEKRPDIVLTDVKMPFMSGIEMLRQSIREIEYKAVILSGYSEFSYAKSAISLGVSEYLLKPVDIYELEDVIARLVTQLQELECGSILTELPQNCRQQMRKVLDIDSIERTPLQDEVVRSMLYRIKDRYEQELSLSQISSEVYMSTSYLNAKFRAVTGYTFHNFLNRYRTLQAMVLLATEDLRIYEVSQRVGFHDYRQFISVFKKYVGIAPAAYQKEILE